MALCIRAMRDTDLGPCAAMACDSEIGQRYGFTPEGMARTLKAALDASSRPGAGDELFVATEALPSGQGPVRGFAWIDLRGAFSSAPYLRLIAVDPTARGLGVGAFLMAEFEERGRAVGRDCILLVSDFNAPARAFYARHGYREVGLLPDFARPGIGEVIMVKPKAHA